MAAITMQRDLIAEMKKETVLNVGILSKLMGMPQDIARQVLKENALEKPTQSLFNQLSYYLVCIIDPKAAETLPWPLYDSKTERAYRNELANLVSQYSSKGLLAPVMTSYLVNPGCYKVSWLIFQMSQLAVQKVLESKMNKESQKQGYNDMTVKYKTEEKDCFLDQIERETERILSKFSNCQHKRKAMEKIAEIMRTKITEMVTKLSSLGAQKFLDHIVDGFISKSKLNNEQKQDICKIKDVFMPAPFFDRWLAHVDQQLDEMETKWSEKVTPFLNICNETRNCTEMLIARHTGEADKDSYMIEYNHAADEINTTDLQNQVNSQQKYILKNIVKDEKLNFPNLIRAFLIAIGFVINGERVGDEIHKFNEYLQGGEKSVNEIVTALQEVVKRVMNAEAKLQPSPVIYHRASIQNFPEIPPLPDLSTIKSTRELHQALFDNFTPLSMSKHQFNLQRRTTLHTFVKPQSRMLLTSFCQGSKDDFFKSIQPGRLNSYDQLNSTQNFHNISIIPQSNRANETIIGTSSGFTKQQLLRLLSTKKSSSSKKFSRPTVRPNIRIKKGGLFNESTSSNESIGLLRSHSSPNLYENKESRPKQRTGARKLSIMQERDSPDFEVSGIAVLDKDSSCEKPLTISPAICSKEYIVTIPTMTVTPASNNKFHAMIKDFKVDLNTEFLTVDHTKRLSEELETKTITPQNNKKLIQKTSSLEKIINRYKKVQAKRTIVEEKENLFTTNKILLPDLLSPSCSVMDKKPGDDFDDMDLDNKVCRRPRESLGTMLEVDQTFLDQFDLID